MEILVLGQPANCIIFEEQISKLYTWEISYVINNLNLIRLIEVDLL